MSEQEKELINDLIAGKLTREELFAGYPVDLSADTNYILRELERATISKNADNIDYALTLLAIDPEFNISEKYVAILSRLILEGWHYAHENIASLLQGIRSPGSIDALYEAALTRFDYLDYDDSYSLARKCIHALGDINTAASKEKLEILAGSDIPILREKAGKQL